MGSLDSAFGNSEGGFEPDDFYESFQAPKFHDFTAPEEPIDPDAFFMAKPGMSAKKPVVMEVKTMALKIHKVAAQDAPKTALQQVPLPPKTPVAAEKAVSAGSAKKGIRGTVSASPSPLTSKSLRNGNSACNSPSAAAAAAAAAAPQPQMLDKLGSGSLKPTSLAKKLQASENDDPNSTANHNSCADHTPSKAAAKHTRKVPEEKVPLTRQPSRKVLEAPHSSQGNSGAPNEVTSDTEKENADLGKGAADMGTPQKKDHSSKPVGGVASAVKVLKLNAATAGKDHSSACKTPVKEHVPSNHQEVKKFVACTESSSGSPYSGQHHCKSSRCAANDPNSLSSPVLTKKYLVAKRSTPGSIRKATPINARVETCNEEVSSDSSAQHKDGEERKLDGAHEVQGKAQIALEDAFKKLGLDQGQASDVEKQVSEQVSVALEVTEKPGGEGFKEVSLEEDRSTDEPAQSQSLGDLPGSSVNCEEKAASSSERRSTVNTNSSANADSNATGVDLFLQVASDCLEKIDLGKLDVPQSKQGKKRKSGELMPEGGSKRANCASGATSKEIPKKVLQAKDPAPKTRTRRFSMARRVTNPRVTNPRPFRLRTQERGALKEIEFNKKMEVYRAAKEGFNSAFQGLAVAEPKIPVKFVKSGHVFSAKRADPSHQDEKENEVKAQKGASTIPHAQKAPLFDHPFKPHRSTKKLTVPQEPKFHAVRGRRTCPTHAVAA